MMHQRLKERLVGAAVLVVIAVIFIPMLLTGPIDSGSITKTNIPDRPTEKFNSKLIPPKLIPLSDSLKPTSEVEKDSSSGEIINENQTITDASEKVSNSSKDIPVKTELNVDISTADKKSTREKIIKDKQVGLTAWVVQLGSFSSKINADKLNLNLRKSGFPAFVEPITQAGKISYRVRVGPEILRADADALLKKIKTKMKLDGIVLNYP
jgi:DedD protein